MVNYYDGIIGGIGVLLAAGVAATSVFGTVALSIFALGAIAMVAHATFVRPPVEYSETTGSAPVAAD